MNCKNVLFKQVTGKIFVGLSLAILPLDGLHPEAKAQAEIVDGVAAIVNDEVITFSQVREIVGAREQALRGAFRGQELVDKIKEARLAALKDLIDRQLILQEFRRNEFKLPNHVVEEQINTIIREQFGGDRQALIKTVQAEGLTMSRFRQLERDKLIVQILRSQKVRNREFVISPPKIQQYYDENKAEFTSDESLKLRLIAINKNGPADVFEETQKPVADEVRQRIANGADFGRMAQMYSEDPSRDLGGDWGWIDRNTLNKDLTQVAFQLRPKEVSRVFELEEVYYILYAEERKYAVTAPLADVRDQIEKKLQQEERQRLQQQWIDSLRENAYIKMF